MKIIGPVLFFIFFFLIIAALLLLLAFGFSWVLAQVAPSLDRGHALVAGSILALGSIHLFMKCMSLIKVFELPDNNESEDDDDDDPDREPPVIIVPPSFPFGPERTRTRRKRKK